MARSTTSSGKRPKKRRAPPNRHSLVNRLAKAKPQEEGQAERPSSASARKLDDFDAKVAPERENWSGFRIIDIDRVFVSLLQHVKCKYCSGSVAISELKSCGLSSVFKLVCLDECGDVVSVRNSDIVYNADGTVETELNRRFVYASQVLGFKHAGMKSFSAILDLPPAISVTLYYATVSRIHNSLKLEAEESMDRAVCNEIREEGSTDIQLSGDGSWQRKGFSSKNGVVSAIGVHTGQVIDVEVMTMVCQVCAHYKGPKSGPQYEQWWESHSEECSKNHEGSSGMMEVTGMVNIFKRSLFRKTPFRIKTYVGDGDSKTFTNIVAAKPYGDELIPVKEECTGHVQKRMGKRLRDLKKSMAGKKLSDKKGIGGRGRLTDKVIDKFASFYGNAIRNAKNVKSMKKSIKAIWCHYRSTDARPSHQYCPKETSTWCKYNKAKNEGKLNTFKHVGTLPPPVMDAIKPVFDDLSKDDLLKRCLGNRTQNPNESLNAVIWKNVPKTVYCGLRILQIGVFDAVCMFNGGWKSRLKLMKRMNMVPGPYCVEFCNKTDFKRVTQADQRTLESTKEARKARRRDETEKRENLKTLEGGETYVAGGF
ncbi:hypothetical protein FOCC_FOCC013896 [Frankliniella occidentalis]|nr:hypothetical protein FOCC_FOCC013896 [Frankliniella occidentalis]